jgi:hypothetical protein
MSSRPGQSINSDQAHGTSARPPAEPNLTSGSSARDVTVLVMTWGVSDDDLSNQLSTIAEWRRSRPSLRPVFVTDSSTFDRVADHGLDIERIDGETAGAHPAHPSTGSLDTRLQEITDKYRPHLVVAAGTAFAAVRDLCGSAGRRTRCLSIQHPCGDDG